jgi:hypothetical protein
MRCGNRANNPAGELALVGCDVEIVPDPDRDAGEILARSKIPRVQGL